MNAVWRRLRSPLAQFVKMVLQSKARVENTVLSYLFTLISVGVHKFEKSLMKIANDDVELPR